MKKILLFISLVVFSTSVTFAQMVANENYPFLLTQDENNGFEYLVSYNFPLFQSTFAIQDTIVINSNEPYYSYYTSRYGKYLIQRQTNDLLLFNTYDDTSYSIEHTFYEIRTLKFYNQEEEKILFSVKQTQSSPSYSVFLYDILENSFTYVFTYLEEDPLLVLDISYDDQKVLYGTWGNSPDHLLFIANINSSSLELISSSNSNNLNSRLNNDGSAVFLITSDNTIPGDRSIRVLNLETGENTLRDTINNGYLNVFGVQFDEDQFYYGRNGALRKIGISGTETILVLNGFYNGHIYGRCLFTPNQDYLFWREHNYLHTFDLENLEEFSFSYFYPDNLIGFINRTIDELNQGDLSFINDLIVENNINYDSDNITEIGDQLWNEVGELAELRMNNFDLLTIPSSIQNLSNINTLDFSHNSITSVPEGIGYLDNLTYLDMSYNSIDTVHPNAFWFLENLDYIDLSNNSIQELPLSYSTIHPDTAILSNNELSSIGNFHGGNTDISYVDLSNNQITTVGDLSYQSLDVSHNYLNSMQSIRGGFINASYNNISNLNYSEGLNDILSLNLDHNNISEISDSIGFYQYLVSLKIGNNQLQELPVALAILDSLVYLSLDSNYLYCLDGEQSISDIPDFLIDGSIETVDGLFYQLCEQVGVDENQLFPIQYSLHQNYPNPFNPITTLRYDLPEQATVNITIYDLLGREIRTLVNTTQDAGFKSVLWNATNDYGKPVSAGVYLYQIQAGEFVQTKKMVLLK